MKKIDSLAITPRAKGYELKGLIFDLDGTLGNSVPLALASFRAALYAVLRIEYSDEWIRRECFGPTEAGAFRRVLGSNWEPGYRRFVSEYKERLQDCARPFCGIERSLETARARAVRLAVVTGRGEETTLLTLEAWDLGRYFDVVEFGSPHGNIKVERIRSALHTFALHARHAAYVGDVPSDVEDARAVGVTAVAAAWAQSADIPALREARPDYVFERVDQLREWIATVTATPGVSLSDS